MQGQKQKVITNDLLKGRWNKFAPVYTASDSTNQAFFYTLSHMLQLHNAQNILEIGCGAAKLLPYVVTLKPNSCKYIASDISDVMIDLARQFLAENIQKFGVEQPLQNWLKRHSISLEVLNGEDQIITDSKFDRIICNLVLQITENPVNMLKNLYNVSEPGCLLGVTIWGEKAESNFLTLNQSALKHLGRPVPNVRNNFHLYNKLEEVASQSGWQILIQWNQNSPYPYYQMCPGLKDLNQYSSPNDKEVTEFTEAKINETFANKKILNFAAQLAILRRK